MRILYVGESWEGSSARSMREALSALPNIHIDEVREDRYFPHGSKSLVFRGFNRLLWRWHRSRLSRDIAAKRAASVPDVMMVYKGSGVSAATIRGAKRSGIFTVNVFPDCSPHAHGPHLKAAMGEYDLVVSAKPFHPAGWKSIYGYSNACVCVLHGYDPAVHLRPASTAAYEFDVVLAATWRLQYQELLQRLYVCLDGFKARVAIIGSGWLERASQLPPQWSVGAPLTGRRYTEWLRGARIALAPVHAVASVDGVWQPGDEDTTRTYELAAAGCFFLHRRTPHAQTLYDEASEVPMWDDAEELAALVCKYLPLEQERRAMAKRAQARAVPAYSIPRRAEQVLAEVVAAMSTDRRAVL